MNKFQNYPTSLEGTGSMILGLINRIGVGSTRCKIAKLFFPRR